MDQLLLDTIHRIESDWQVREVRLRREMDALRQEVAARDEAIANLTTSLAAWLDPAAPPQS
ncbi:hypothetical protein GI374_00030 [Paracoccus sp. S-4012]|uniref:hypothetical protein n=1 Tax=Paracoccus sp. S-4012 TaxID=2665648 RepID=UPI0012B0E8EA|nr:hypothetical protein [Paracoccus sp. S-4012]MRX48850.1 hypothetical protein [Paracoccus sp. S-4012]